MGKYDAVCRKCGKPIHQVGYSDGSMRWEHKPEPGEDAGKTFDDQGMSHKAVKS